jgi:hypothetical protein
MSVVVRAPIVIVNIFLGTKIKPVRLVVGIESQDGPYT